MCIHGALKTAVFEQVKKKKNWRVILIILLLRRYIFQAKMYRSQCKSDKPHIVAITIIWCYSIYMNHSAQHC